jgi:hypothetical protein
VNVPDDARAIADDVSLVSPRTDKREQDDKSGCFGQGLGVGLSRKDARQRTGGKSGVYEFYTDDAGNSLLILDGHIFHGRPAFEDILVSLGELGGAPDRNFIFERGIITETEIVDKK